MDPTDNRNEWTLQTIGMNGLQTIGMNGLQTIGMKGHCTVRVQAACQACMLVCVCV